jgi:hypothetical protein
MIKTAKDLQSVRETRQRFADSWNALVHPATPSEDTCKIHDINYSQLYAICTLSKIIGDDAVLERLSELETAKGMGDIARIFNMDVEALP